jgi:hypothetical protein
MLGKGTTAPTVNYDLAEGTQYRVRLNGYTYGIGLGLGTVVGYRSDEEMHRLLDLVRQVPGAVDDLRNIGEWDWSKWPTLHYSNLLADEGSEETFVAKLIEASRPGTGLDGGR